MAERISASDLVPAEKDEYMALTNGESLTQSKLTEVDQEDDERVKVIDVLSWQKTTNLMKNWIIYRALKSGSPISIKDLLLLYRPFRRNPNKDKEL